MTQITIRQVDEELAESIRNSAKTSGESMNALLLRLLRRQFLNETGASADTESPRNDLRKFRRGWVEDPECDAALESFGEADQNDWR